MKISKHIHSCLLVEDAGKTAIIDPGNLSYEALDRKALTNLDYILITHEHPDHMHLPFIKDLLKQFPEAKIISNPAIATILAEEQIIVHTDLSVIPADANIRFEEVSHERIFDREAPQNVMFEVFGKLAHPGDSMSFETHMEVLALPLLGPSWMVTQAVEKALTLKPKTIIPIHDNHWRDDFRKDMYKRLEGFFQEHGIDFKSIETGHKIAV